MTKEKENPSTEKSQIISELANKLGFSVDLLQSVVGNRIKPTFSLSQMSRIKLVFIISRRENEGYYTTFGKKLW